MTRYRTVLIGVGALGLLASASLVACNRTSSSESAAPGPGGGGGSAVRDDMKALGKATEKAAKDIGQATSDLAGKAGANSDDIWITTKVKGELTQRGFDPLHVHVDTSGRVVTLSGGVETAAKRQEAVDLAKAVTGVTRVEDHLFVGPAKR
jgi:osmotically-inducible protein OsmY